MEWTSCIDKRLLSVNIFYTEQGLFLVVFRQEYRTEEDIDVIYVVFKVSKLPLVYVKLA